MIFAHRRHRRSNIWTVAAAPPAAGGGSDGAAGTVHGDGDIAFLRPRTPLARPTRLLPSHPQPAALAASGDDTLANFSLPVLPHLRHEPGAWAEGRFREGTERRRGGGREGSWGRRREGRTHSTSHSQEQQENKEEDRTAHEWKKSRNKRRLTGCRCTDREGVKVLLGNFEITVGLVGLVGLPSCSL